MRTCMTCIATWLSAIWLSSRAGSPPRWNWSLNRPFLYFPLGHHFEQAFHVPHRLARCRAGRRMEYATATPEVIGAAIAAEIGRHVAYRRLTLGPSAGSRARSPDVVS